MTAAIQPHLDAIRDRQRKATPGRWVRFEDLFHTVETTPPHFVRASGDGVVRGIVCECDRREDYNYITAACSPDDGDVTRLLAAVEVLAEALEFYADRNYSGYDVHVTDYGLSTEEGHIIADKGRKASEALDHAAAILRGDS